MVIFLTSNDYCETRINLLPVVIFRFVCDNYPFEKDESGYFLSLKLRNYRDMQLKDSPTW